MLKLRELEPTFSVCKLEDISMTDLSAEFCFIAKTDEEVSLVCSDDAVPDHVIEREEGWKAFCIEGILDFSLIGILAQISSVLAAESIGIFVVSTYNTDYVLVKKENFDRALKALSESGYRIA